MADDKKVNGATPKCCKEGHILLSCLGEPDSEGLVVANSEFALANTKENQPSPLQETLRERGTNRFLCAPPHVLLRPHLWEPPCNQDVHKALFQGH